jgi:hypothetical protein
MSLNKRRAWILNATLGVLVVTGTAQADELTGTWVIQEAKHGGSSAQGTLTFRPGAAPGTWQATARDLPAPSETARWTGTATLDTHTVRIDISGARGIAGGLSNATSASGLARYTLAGDTLLGGWELAGESAREVLTRAESERQTLRPRGPLEPADGAFGAGSDAWPQLNANHPEILTSVAEGRVLVVSTLAPEGKADPGAHLDHTFDRRFRIFASNQNRTGRRIWQVLALFNPGTQTVRVRVGALASASTRAAPYTDLAWATPDEVVDDDVLRASGPGETASTRALLGTASGPLAYQVPPGGVALISVRPLENREERMTHAHLYPDGPVAAAVLYLPGSQPSTAQVKQALRSGHRVPRSEHDHQPTPPDATRGALIFGRVSGVVAASHWEGTLTNDSERKVFLTLPGEERSFLWNAKHGTVGRAQAGRVLTRLPDSAYRSWGNYGGSFALRAPLRNPTEFPQRIAIFIDSPGSGRARALRQGFELRVEGPNGVERRFARVSQRMGTRGQTPLFVVEVPAASARLVTLRAVYAANNTAPNPVRLEVLGSPSR